METKPGQHHCTQLPTKHLGTTKMAAGRGGGVLVEYFHFSLALA